MKLPPIRDRILKVLEVDCFVTAAVFALYAGVYELGYLGEPVSGYSQRIGMGLLLVIIGFWGWSRSARALADEERDDGGRGQHEGG